MQHLFCQCEFVVHLKQKVYQRSRQHISGEILCKQDNRCKMQLHAILNFVLWSETCRRVFAETSKQKKEIYHEIMQEKILWINTLEDEA